MKSLSINKVAIVFTLVLAFSQLVIADSITVTSLDQIDSALKNDPTTVEKLVLSWEVDEFKTLKQAQLIYDALRLAEHWGFWINNKAEVIPGFNVRIKVHFANAPLNVSPDGKLAAEFRGKILLSWLWDRTKTPEARKALVEMKNPPLLDLMPLQAAISSVIASFTELLPTAEGEDILLKISQERERLAQKCAADLLKVIN
ncbi:MAG: hypothetical protein SGI74_13755 [Oligoflexia bacterium]|nr:hypothetical protein [Oligoflexia bacterium]